MAKQAKELYQKATFDRYSGSQEQEPQQPAAPVHRGKAHNQRSKREALAQQPPAEPVPHYSTNLPPKIQEILKFQAQVPYNIIANTIQYRLDKPYVPQAVASSQPTQYRPQYIQGQAGKTNVRPVTE